METGSTLWEKASGAIRPAFSGTVEMDGLTDISQPFLFLLSDADQERFAEGLSSAQMERLVVFQVENPSESADFAEALQKAYIAHCSELSDHMGYYDPLEEQRALKAGEEYGYSGSIGLLAEGFDRLDDWKYAPFLRVLAKRDAMVFISVFVLLGLYVAVISLAATGIMTYVRSVTIAIDNRPLLESLKKLGADLHYRQRVMRSQLGKIFFYPAMAGSCVSLLFSLLMCWFNDMRLTAFEISMLAAELGLIAIICVFLFFMYRISFRKTQEIIEGAKAG